MNQQTISAKVDLPVVDANLDKKSGVNRSQLSHVANVSQAASNSSELSPAQAKVLAKTTIEKLPTSGMDMLQNTKVMQNLKKTFPSEHTQLNLQIQHEQRKLKAEAQNLPPISQKSIDKWFNGQVQKATVLAVPEKSSHSPTQTVVVAINKEQVTLTYPASANINFTKGQQLALVVDKVEQPGTTPKVQLLLKNSPEQSQVLIQAETKLGNTQNSLAPLMASVDAIHKQVGKPQAQQIYPKEFIQAVKSLVSEFTSTQQISSKEGIQQAVKNSGLFLEKNIQFTPKSDVITNTSKNIELISKELAKLEVQAKELAKRSDTKIAVPAKLIQQYNQVATQIVLQSKLADIPQLSMDTVKNNLFDRKQALVGTESRTVLSSLVNVMKSDAMMLGNISGQNISTVSNSIPANLTQVTSLPASALQTNSLQASSLQASSIQNSSLPMNVPIKTVDTIQQLDRPLLNALEQTKLADVQKAASQLFEKLRQDPATAKINLTAKDIQAVLSTLSRLMLEKETSNSVGSTNARTEVKPELNKLLTNQPITNKAAPINLSARVDNTQAVVIDKLVMAKINEQVLSSAQVVKQTNSQNINLSKIEHNFNSINKAFIELKPNHSKLEVQQLLSSLSKLSLNPSDKSVNNVVLDKMVQEKLTQHKVLTSEQQAVVSAQKKEISQAISLAVKAYENTKTDKLVQQIVNSKTPNDTQNALKQLSASIDVKKGLMEPQQLKLQQIAKVAVESINKTISPVLANSEPTKTLLKQVNLEVKTTQELKQQFEKIDKLLTQMDKKSVESNVNSTASKNDASKEFGQSVQNKATQNQAAQNTVAQTNVVQNITMQNTATQGTPAQNITTQNPSNDRAEAIKQIQKVLSEINNKSTNVRPTPSTAENLSQKAINDILQQLQSKEAKGSKESTGNQFLKSLIQTSVKSVISQFPVTQQLLSQVQIPQSGKLSGNELLSLMQQTLSVKQGSMPSAAMTELSPKLFNSLQSLLATYQTQFKDNNPLNTATAQTATQATAQQTAQMQFTQQMSQLQQNLTQMQAQYNSGSMEANKQSLSDFKANIHRLLTVLKEMPSVMNSPMLQEQLATAKAETNPVFKDEKIPTKNKHAQVIKATQQIIPPIGQFAMFQQQLTDQLESTLARLVATQINTREQGEQQNTLSLEIPFRFLDKTQIMQMKFHAQEKSEQPDEKVWTANLAFELEALGAIRVYITLDNKDVAMQFWAEEQPTQTVFQKNFSILSERLREAGYSISQLKAFHGIPGDAQEEQVKEQSVAESNSLVDERV